MGLHADSVDAGVGAAAAGHLLEGIEDADLFVVDRFGLGNLAGHTQALGETVDGDNAFGAEQVDALDGELADRAAAPDARVAPGRMSDKKSTCSSLMASEILIGPRSTILPMNSWPKMSPFSILGT